MNTHPATFDALLTLAQASFDARGISVTPEVLQATAKALGRLALPPESPSHEAHAHDFAAMLQRCSHA